jgi:single-stranded DNA-binding protein
MNNLTLTIVGNLTDDPELRFTPRGADKKRVTSRKRGLITCVRCGGCGPRYG